MTLDTWIDLIYLLAIIGFILALKGLSSPKHARNGNLLGAAAATLAVGFTFAYPSVRAHSLNLVLTVVAMAIGALIAVPAARKVKMTAMPQMVAIFNGVGGGAAALDLDRGLPHRGTRQARRVPDRRGAVRRARRVRVVLRERHRLCQAAGADDRSAHHLSGSTGDQCGGGGGHRRRWPSAPS